MDTNFPGSVWYMKKPPVAHELMEIDDPEVEFISLTRVRKSIWSFGVLKSEGPVERKTIVLKHLGEKAVNKIVEFLEAKSLLGYYPRWRESKAVFIPKPGKSNYSHVRSIRPISLSSFIMNPAILDSLVITVVIFAAMTAYRIN